MPAQRITIRVAPDGLAAFVSVRRGEVATAQEWRAALAAAGVVEGLCDVALKLADPSFACVDVPIARGVAPSVGRAARLELAMDLDAAAGSVSADGHMDFRERGWLKPVTTGQVIAKWHAAEMGAAGLAVDGRVLPGVRGADWALQWGEGVALDDAGAVRATRAGVVLYKPGVALDVVNEHTHHGPVDLRCGNLEMSGSLTVKGDVERLLQVRASGDVEVLGSVQGGTVRAGGSVRVSGTVRGGDGSRVIAEHDVSAKRCEVADVTAAGVARVEDAVNSELRGGHVVVSGRMRGGSASAERSLIVREATGALLQAGVPLELPDLEQVQRAVLLQKLRRMAERGGVRDAFGARGMARGKGGKLGRVQAAQSSEEVQQLAAKARQRAELLRHAVVELGRAHANVRVCIGATCVDVDQGARGVRYALNPETGQLVAERILA